MACCYLVNIEAVLFGFCFDFFFFLFFFFFSPNKWMVRFGLSMTIMYNSNLVRPLSRESKIQDFFSVLRIEILQTAIIASTPSSISFTKLQISS